MAMGITQALKLEQGPIDALAKLPQQQLIQMAQQGRIGADILPIILNEKAQMIQQAANMQAAQRPMPPTVVEQAMATNAQAEAQPQMQAQPQAPMGGIANLPVPDEMYGSAEEQGYAGGGIVAFGAGGSTDPWVEQDGINYLREEVAAPEGPIKGLPDYVKQYQGIMGMVPGRANLQNMLAEEAKYQADYRARAAQEADQNKWMRLLQAGLGIMGGESPYFGVNVGKGAQEAAKGYAEDVREQRKQEQAARQARLALAKQEYDINAADIVGGLKLHETATEREFKAEQEQLNRENRLAVAQIPDKTIQVADKLRRDNPNMTYLESVSAAAQALSPKDTYNATRMAVSAAAKDAKAEFAQRVLFDPKLQADMKKAAEGDIAAQARVQAVRDKIEQETFRLYQVEGINLSEGRMGAPERAPARSGASSGKVDTSNPLLR